VDINRPEATRVRLTQPMPCMLHVHTEWLETGKIRIRPIGNCRRTRRQAAPHNSTQWNFSPARCRLFLRDPSCLVMSIRRTRKRPAHLPQYDWMRVISTARNPGKGCLRKPTTNTRARAAVRHPENHPTSGNL